MSTCPIDPIERIFPADCLRKRERVERTLNHQPVDRAAIHEQLSYNTAVISLYTGRQLAPFAHTVDDICAVIRATLDMCFPPVSPCGVGRDTTQDGFVMQRDNWHRAIVGRPFSDERGAARWLDDRLRALRQQPFDPNRARERYRESILSLQRKIGDTVILDYSSTRFCWVYERMGLDIFSFCCLGDPRTMLDFMEESTATEVRRIHAVADRSLSPAVLIPEDFGTRQGPMFSADFLRRFHYPFVRRLAEAWHARGQRVLYHSDGNYRSAIPDLIACGVDGFYCLEPACGMDIVELSRAWPDMVWAGGVDGVNLMELSSPQQVRAEVHRQICQTHALDRGGIFIATSSEINPLIPAENFRAMIEAVGEMTNPAFGQGRGSPCFGGGTPNQDT